MSVIGLYLLSFPLGMTSIFLAYQASREFIGRGERTILMACSCGLLWSMFLIFLVMLSAL